EEVCFKLRELRSAEESVAVDDERRGRFEVTVFARVHVEHEIDQGAFETRARAVENRETRGCEPRRSFQIEYSETQTEIDVVLRCKTELGLRTPTTDLLIVLFAFA